MASCTFHPGRDTLVGCTRCARPACPECLVVAPVGMQCRACVAGLPTDRPLTGRESAALRRGSGGRAGRGRRRPGWVFYALVGLFVAAATTLYAVSANLGWYSLQAIPTGLRILGTGVVIIGAVLSVTLHEWGHAIVALRGGDHTVVEKGYLTLDPRKYADPLLSIAMPVVFLLLGGLPLPGGAVWIEEHRLRGRWWRSAVSLAGVVMNLLFGVLLVGLVQVTPIRDDPSLGGALSFLALMQFSLVLLNLLPVPGLDGYGVLEPHLPRGLAATLAPMRRFGLMLVFALIWWTPVLDVIWRGAWGIGQAVGLSDLLVAVGAELADPRWQR